MKGELDIYFLFDFLFDCVSLYLVFRLLELERILSFKLLEFFILYMSRLKVREVDCFGGIVE